MQVLIDEVVSQVRAGSESGPGPDAVRRIVSAVLAALEKQKRGEANRAEEMSLLNHQQRSKPGSD